MDFFCYHRDRAGSDPLREELAEAHWSYMDGFAEGLIARGPTLTEDGRFATGSVHIVDLPGPAEARAFAFDEPNYQAGVYRDVLLRRWDNRLGRTMWQFTGSRDANRRFLVLGLGEPRPFRDSPGAERGVDTDGLIACGSLLSDNGATWLGTTMLVVAASPEEARDLLIDDDYAEVEVHPWQFGGRPG